ncbi:beta-propeller fold lactonase family protein [Pseudoduganella sp. RAF19]|uniref:YVTN family beta-propeller repeat protein n=1 Tax=Pseudoduganella sp. RAF19 TaxID=3233052 RepID=UPI003F9B303E
MNTNKQLIAAVVAVFAMPLAFALPSSQDRVYTADQNSNTVSVFDPSTNTLVGQIRLGNPRPDVLSPLYKGEINVHGMGFSPDHKTLMVISTGSNSATFIDTATNKVKGKTYVGRSPHEGFFTADGKEAWVVVRGEDYISVIDPQTFREKERIQTEVGPGMVQFHPDGKLAFVVSSFTPTVDIIDVKSKKIIKRITVTSPFSPFLQFSPDYSEIWMTHKDVGKVTRIDTRTLEVTGVIDTGFITNHLAFAKVNGKTLAYVTIGGENVVKVYTTDKDAKLVATIPTGALPHGIWTSDDSNRVFVGMENGDGMQVIDPATNRVIATIAGGQAPQALVYISHAVPQGDGKENLVPRTNKDSVNVQLRPKQGEGRGFIVSRNLGVVDAVEVSLFKLKPNTEYSVYLNGASAATGSLVTNAQGMANATMIGPVRELAKEGAKAPHAGEVLVMEGHDSPDAAKAIMTTAR